MAGTSSLAQNPAPATEHEVERAMRLNIWAGAFGTVWMMAAYGMPLPLFMKAIGATGVQLGVLAAVRQLAMLAQLPSALFVERLEQRKPFWATVAATHRALWIAPALLPWLWPDGAAHWPVVLIVALGASDLLGNASTAPWLSWMADLLPPARAGRFWGLRQRMLSVVAIAAALAFGLLLDFTNRGSQALGGFAGFALVFTIATICGVGDIAVHWRVHEPAPERNASPIPIWQRLAAPLRQRDFRRLTLAMGAWSAALALPGYSNGTPGFFNLVYLQESFGASYSEASALVLASALGAVIWTPRIGRRVDEFGARGVAGFLMLVGPLFLLAWFFAAPGRIALPFLGRVPHPVVLMSVASLVIGGFFAGVVLCQMRLTQALTAGGPGRTVAMAVHWSAVGFMGAFGAISGGWIKDHFPRGWSALVLPGGAPFSYFQVLILLHLAIAWGVALPLLRSVAEPARSFEKTLEGGAPATPTHYGGVSGPPDA